MSYTKDGRAQVSTNGLTLFDPRKVILKTNFLDSSLSIALWLPGPKPDGSMGYPEQTRYFAIIRAEQAAALYNILTHQVMDAIAEKRSYQGGVFINKDRTAIVQFEVEPPETEDSLPVVSLSYMIGIDMNKNPKTTIVYEFATSAIIENFKANKDTDSVRVTDVQAQLWLFGQYLKAFLANSSNATAHSYRMAQNFFNDRLYKSIEQIAVKVGAPLPVYGGNKNTGTISTEVVAPASSVPVPTEIVENINDIPF